MSRVVASGVERIIVIPGKGGRVQAVPQQTQLQLFNFNLSNLHLLLARK
jgi:hypothetical protein